MSTSAADRWPLADRAFNFRAMNGSKKDVDPATELVEEDEDAALPELE